MLVVDDVEINRKLLRGQLEIDNHRAFFAANGVEALDILAVQAVDLILMDLHMPVLDGIQTTRRIKANPELASTPIIGITANVTPAINLECLSCGMDTLVDKPISQSKLRYDNSIINSNRAKYDYIFKLKVLEFYFGIPISEIN